MNKKKRILIKLSVCLSVIVFAVLYFISPRQIIKRTVMRYERDFTIPVFCRQIRFEYDIKTGSYCGKYEISKRQADNNETDGRTQRLNALFRHPLRGAERRRLRGCPAEIR